MKKVLVLGIGCAACEKLAALVLRAADELEVPVELEKIGDLDRILAYDIAATPGLVVDGELRSAGRVPPLAEIKRLIR